VVASAVSTVVVPPYPVVKPKCAWPSAASLVVQVTLAQVLNAEATATFEIAGAVVSGMMSNVRRVGEAWMLPLSSTART
jgi:hypothetical protein